MPRPRWPHLHKEQTRHGKTVWYVRVEKGPRTRIKEEFGTPEFRRAYDAAIAGEPLQTKRKVQSGSIAWAIRLYMHSQAWSGLSPSTRKQRGCILRTIENSDFGSDRLKAVVKADIVAGCKRRAAAPAAARHFLQTMRGLYNWAINEDLASTDPTAGVFARAAKTDGHLPWTEADVEAYERRWALGTRERLAFDLLLDTGLRRGDAVLVGRQHVKDGIIRLNTEKTGERVVIVMGQKLLRSIEAGPCGELTFIAGERGRPRVKESFGEWFREACIAAGVRKTAHGLRKTAATRDADSGYSEAELEAKYGWRGGRMASHYTRSANRERLSISAAKRVAENGT